MTHTPGPWVVNRSDYEDTASIGSPDWWGLAEVIIRLDGDISENPSGAANAHLIAAAPDLYAELVDLVDWLEFNKRSIGALTLESWLLGARAAIAKAEGRS